MVSLSIAPDDTSAVVEEDLPSESGQDVVSYIFTNYKPKDFDKYQDFISKIRKDSDNALKENRIDEQTHEQFFQLIDENQDFIESRFKKRKEEEEKKWDVKYVILPLNMPLELLEIDKFAVCVGIQSSGLLIKRLHK